MIDHVHSHDLNAPLPGPAIVRRRTVVAALNGVKTDFPQSDWARQAPLALKPLYLEARDTVRRRLLKTRRGGHMAARSLSDITDIFVRSLFDFAAESLFPVGNPTDQERLAVIATGGYGRRELAPYSDLDILFLIPGKGSAWAEQIIESLLYMLWDMGFKIGHAVRNNHEALRLANEDLTILTSLLETRFLAGDQTLANDLNERVRTDLFTSNTLDFIEAKLEERDTRHNRLGDTRYVVEPNIKDGKGGLRDLHTMWWIIRFLAAGARREKAFDPDILSNAEFERFCRAEAFLWSVRMALHFVAKRPEERLTFAYQQQLADLLGYRSGAANLQVERFMKHYFSVAKEVGDLTRIFCAVLEERHQKKSILARLMPRRRIKGFRLEGARVMVQDPANFDADPVRMIEIFAVMTKYDLDIHPDALRLIKRSLRRIDDSVRADPRANAAFLEVLTSPKGSDFVLRRMNEAGVFGRFMPDFGRVVAQMQFDMYHHFTVDEHTIRAVSLLSKVEAGLLVEDHPIASEMIHKLVSKPVLYVAVLLHDIAKGRNGDHSILGAEIAYEVGPRLGLSEAETDMVAWLVRWHLLMSNTAFKRDLADPKTVEDFCAQVKSPERLRLLLILTVVDIRAVGPGVWNNWKAQLLRDLFALASQRLMAGHMTAGRPERVSLQKDLVSKAMAGRAGFDLGAHLARWRDAYWVAEDEETLLLNAQLAARAEETGAPCTISLRADRKYGATFISVFARDRVGLFAHLVGALSAAGAVIRSAKIHTGQDGWAVDNFIVQSGDGKAISGTKTLEKLEASLLSAAAGKPPKRDRIDTKRSFDRRQDAFTVVPVALMDSKASNQALVIEVNAKDRPGLLYDLASVLRSVKLSIISAHIDTYGERAVDVFYVREKDGTKPVNKLRLKAIAGKLEAAAREPGAAEDAA